MLKLLVITMKKVEIDCWEVEVKLLVRKEHCTKKELKDDVMYHITSISPQIESDIVVDVK